MTEKNNLPTVDTNTGEIIPQETIVRETDDYTVVQLPNGKFKKNMKYKDYASLLPETEDESIELYKVLNDENSGLVTPLKNMQDKEITIQNIFTRGYQSFDEETGNSQNGVVITIQDVDGSYYATSSKTVYFKTKNLFESFGYPNTKNYKPIKVKVVGTRRENGVQIDLSFVGLA